MNCFRLRSTRQWFPIVGIILTHSLIAGFQRSKGVIKGQCHVLLNSVIQAKVSLQCEVFTLSIFFSNERHFYKENIDAEKPLLECKLLVTKKL